MDRSFQVAEYCLERVLPRFHDIRGGGKYPRLILKGFLELQVLQVEGHLQLLHLLGSAHQVLARVSRALLRAGGRAALCQGIGPLGRGLQPLIQPGELLIIR